MHSSSREEIVEVLDALEAGYKRALDLTFDALGRGLQVTLGRQRNRHDERPNDHAWTKPKRRGEVAASVMPVSIPDWQTLMRPVLVATDGGEPKSQAQIRDIVAPALGLCVEAVEVQLFSEFSW